MFKPNFVINLTGQGIRKSPKALSPVRSGRLKGAVRGRVYNSNRTKHTQERNQDGSDYMQVYERSLACMEMGMATENARSLPQIQNALTWRGGFKLRF